MVSLKISKTLGLLQKLHDLLPRSALITIYKAFVRPYLDYGKILYDQAYNMSFHHKLKFIQYNACLAITGAIRGKNFTKNQVQNHFSYDIGTENQKCFTKLAKTKVLNTFFNYHLKKLRYMLQETLITFRFKIRHIFFKNSFFPSTIIEGNDLSPTLRN